MQQQLNISVSKNSEEDDDDGTTTRVVLEESFEEEPPFIRVAKPPADTTSDSLFSSPATSLGNGTHDPSPAAAPLDAPLPPVVTLTPTEIYVQAVLNQIESAFDLSGLARCVATTRHEVVPFKDGVATFDLKWFSGVHEYVGAVLAAVAEGESGTFSIPDGHSGIEFCAARRSFTQSLSVWIDNIVQKYCYQPCTYRRRNASEVEILLKGINNRWVQSSLEKQKHSATSNMATSIEELNALLLHDFESWFSSFFPYLSYAATARRQLQLLWLENTYVDKTEVAFQVYSMATRVNLLDKGDGVAKGALFPVKWIHELLHWLCDSESKETEEGKEDGEKDEGSNSPVPTPGPFDTLSLTELTVGFPVKQVVREENDEADIIPEELFDLFWSLFGGGPKYLVRGVFRMRQLIEESLRPRRACIAVVFEGVNEQQPVLLESVLYRASIAEVMRRALNKLVRDCKGGDMDEEMWWAALCSDHVVSACVTHTRGEKLSEVYRLAHSGTITFGEVMRQLGLDAPLEPDNENNSNKSEAADLQLLLHQGHLIGRIIVEACGVCGLKNIGNTCYMNCALQCLSNFGSMRRELLSLPLSEYSNSPITVEFVGLLLKLWSGHLQVVEPRRLKMMFGKVEKRFDSCDQQDAMEFVEVLLDRMHDEMNTVAYKKYRERLDTDKSIPTRELSAVFWKDFLHNNRSFIPQLFFHQSKTRLECLACGETTIVFENNPTLAATVAAPPKKRVYEVNILTPAERRVQLRVGALCDSSSPASLDDVVREVEARLLSMDAAVTGIATTSTSTTAALASTPFAPAAGSPTAPADLPEAAPTATAPDFDAETTKPTLNGYRLILHMDPLRPLPAESIFLQGALIADQTETEEALKEEAASAQEQEQQQQQEHEQEQKKESEEGESGEEGESEEATEAEKEEEREEVEKRENAYVWYYLRARSEDWYTQHILCHVERLPTKEALGQSLLEHHIVRRCRELGKRFLRATSTGANELWISTLGPQADAVGDTWVSRHISVFYQSSKHAMEHPISVRSTVTEARGWTGMKAIDAFSGEARILLEYDEYFLEPVSSIYNVVSHNMNGMMSPFGHSCISNINENCGSVTIEDCLRSTFMPDILSDDNAIHCGKCKAARDSKVERSLFLLPRCLVISLKRFKVGRMQEASKNTTMVTFSHVLDVSPYVDPESPEQNTTYTLRGVMYHSGTMNHGHYTAVAYNDNAKQWIHYDDGRVMPLEENRFTQDAYVLCYERDGAATCETKCPSAENSGV